MNAQTLIMESRFSWRARLVAFLIGIFGFIVCVGDLWLYQRVKDALLALVLSEIACVALICTLFGFCMALFETDKRYVVREGGMEVHMKGLFGERVETVPLSRIDRMKIAKMKSPKAPVEFLVETKIKRGPWLRLRPVSTVAEAQALVARLNGLRSR